MRPLRAFLDPPECWRQSAISGERDLEVRASPHLFLRQSLLVDHLRAWVDHRDRWPAWVSSLARSWLTSDLRDRCITRDLTWGVPVPGPGYAGKAFYVWFDAPITYLAEAKSGRTPYHPSEIGEAGGGKPGT